MASGKSSASVALFLALNLVLCNLALSGNPYPPISQCPRDTLKLKVCVNVLNGLLNLGVGVSPRTQKQCCSLVKNLVDANVAACLCTAVHANILNVINLNLPIDLSLLVNKCARQLPSGFQCPR